MFNLALNESSQFILCLFSTPVDWLLFYMYFTKDQWEFKLQIWSMKCVAADSASSAPVRGNTELMRSKRLLCEICRLILALWRDEAPSICIMSWKYLQSRGTTCRSKKKECKIIFFPDWSGKKRNERRTLTFTTMSFFSSGFPSGNFSPKHM